MGPVVVSVATSNPGVATTDGFDVNWLLLDGSPYSALGLQGQDPWVKLGIQGDTKIAEIRIVPGKNDAVDSFGQYGRPKTVKITLSDGSSSTVTLADEPSVQEFPVAGTADWVQLDVIDSYPGTQERRRLHLRCEFRERADPGLRGIRRAHRGRHRRRPLHRHLEPGHDGARLHGDVRSAGDVARQRPARSPPRPTDRAAASCSTRGPSCCSWWPAWRSPRPS